MSIRNLSDSDSQNQKLDQAIMEFLRAQEDGEPLDFQELMKKHADVADDLGAFIDQQIRFGKLTAPVRNFSALTVDIGNETTIKEFGDYKIIREVGRGGMGVIYEAMQKGLSRRVALKMIRDSRFRTNEDLVRFQAESEAAAALEHPNIVPVYRVGSFEGHPFFTMKLIRGGSLKQTLENGKMTPAESARIALAIAKAVCFAHQRGILHRDLKPANILLDSKSDFGSDTSTEAEPVSSSGSNSDGLPVPMISDFGLAKQLDQELDHGLTMTGAVLGTPQFMAPEQAAGKATTTSTDIYAVGAILYNMLTGDPPFTGNSPAEITRKVIDQTPKRIGWKAKIDLDLETICMTCLEKDPSGRYLSAGELAEDLESWIDGKPIRARRSGAFEQFKKWAGRHPRFATLMFSSAALLILTLVGAIAFSFRLNAEVAKRGETLAQLRSQESETATQRDSAIRRLFESKFAEVSARRSSGDIGQQFGALKAAKEAVEQLPFVDVTENEIFELRSETAGCLGNADIKETAQWHVDDFGPLRMNTFSPDLSLFVNQAKIGAPVDIHETQQLIRTGSVDKSTPIASFDVDGQISGYQCQFSNCRQYMGVNTVLEENGKSVLTQYVFDIVNQEVIYQKKGGAFFTCFGEVDSEKLLATSDAKHITIFRLPDLKKIATWKNPAPRSNNQMSFSPDGKWLARYGGDGVFIIDVESGEMVWQKHGKVGGLDWHPEKSEVVISNLTAFQIWDLETTPRLVKTFPRHSSVVYRVKYAAGGSVVAASTWGFTTHFWNIQSGEQICSYAGTLDRFADDGRSFGFCGDVSGIGELDSGRLRRTISNADSPHPGSQPIDLDVHSNDRWIAMGDWTKVRLCDLKTGTRLVDLPGYGMVRFHPDGKSLFVGNQSLNRWPITEEVSDDGKLKLILGPPKKIEAIDPKHRNFDFDIDSTGKYLAYLAFRQGAFLVNLADSSAKPVRLGPLSSTRGGISVSANGRLVAVGNHQSKNCRVFDGRTGELLFMAPTPTHARCSLSPDGKLLAVTYNITADVYDTKTQKKLYSLDGSDFDVGWPRSFSKDGKLLLFTLRKPRGTLIVDAISGERLIRIPGAAGTAPRDTRSLLTNDYQLVTIKEGNSLESWDLASIRNKLSEIGLDWDSNQPSISKSYDGTAEIPTVEVRWAADRWAAYENTLIYLKNRWSWNVAEQAFEDWLADNPNDPDLWHGNARVKSRLGDRSAIEDIARAIELSGDGVEPEIYFLRATTRRKLNLKGDVVSDLATFLDHAENSQKSTRMKAVQLLAWELGLQGKHQHGEYDALQLAETYAASLGAQKLIQKDFQGWLEHTLQLPSSEPKPAMQIVALKTLGLALLRSGKPNVARRLLETIAPSNINRISEANYGVQFLLAVCEVENGNRDKALKYFTDEMESKAWHASVSAAAAIDWLKLKSLAEKSLALDAELEPVESEPATTLRWSPADLAARANWQHGFLKVQFFPVSNEFVDATGTEFEPTKNPVRNLYWETKQPEGKITFELDVAAAGKHDGRIYLAHSFNYGLFEFELNRKPVGRRFNGQAARAVFGDFIDLADIELRKGTNRLTVRNVGKAGDSGGFRLGVESVEFTQK